MALLWTDELLDGLRLEGDPGADAVVAAHFEARPDAPPHDLVRRIAAHEALASADQPDEVSRFLADEPPQPAWAEPARIRIGEQFFEQWSPQILVSLLLASLPEAYAGAKGVQVLHLTGRLATDTTRRLVETTQMVVDVMTPGGLEVGGRGYRTARRVRLMHAGVRRLIAEDARINRTCDESSGPRWCSEWGVPINQEDLLGTLMTFTVTIFESLPKLGVRFDEAGAAAYLHSWNIVGHLLGIRPDLLPVDMASASALSAAIRRRQQAASPEGVEMTAALVDMAASFVRPRVLSGFPHTAMRYLAGDGVADMLGLGRGDWTRVLLRPARRLSEVLSVEERHDRLLRVMSARLNRSFIEGFLLYERGGRRPAFAIPTRLADAWGITPGVGARRTAVDGVGATGTG